MAQPEIAAFLFVDSVLERTYGPGLHAYETVARIDGSVRRDGARSVAGAASERTGAVAVGAFALEGVYLVERVVCWFTASLAFFDHPGYKFVLERKFENAMVIIGEIGGNEEELAAEYLKTHEFNKPVIAVIAGKNAPKGRSMGHAGAIVSADGTGSAENKEKALREAGVYIAEYTQHILDICLKLKEEGKL
jgi:hypothetical protein